MSGELEDIQLARRWLPWGLGNRRVGTDADPREGSDISRRRRQI